MPQSPASELLEYHYGDKLSGEAVSISIAAGPYTLDDDLSYEPLQALIDVAIRERPDVLILVGLVIQLIIGSANKSSSDRSSIRNIPRSKWAL
jgi:hypothetical protein